MDIDEERPVESVVVDLSQRLARTPHANGGATSSASSSTSATGSGCRFEYTQSSRALQEWLRLDEKTGLVRVNSRIDREALLERSCFPNQAQTLLHGASGGWGAMGIGHGQVQMQEKSWPCDCRSGGGQGLGSGLEPANCSMGLVMYHARCGDEDLRPLTFRVFVSDVDDHQPRFSVNASELTVTEHSPRGTTIELPVALDRDGPKFANVSYDLNVSSPAVPFAVRKRGGRPVLEVVGELDHERHAVYYLNLSARNAWEHSRRVCSWVALKVALIDLNDHSPQFDRQTYTANVPENAAPGTLVAAVRATDRDSGDNGALEYQLDEPTMNAGIFELNPTTGEIRVASQLDYERASRYEFLVIGKDRMQSQPGDGERRQDTATVVVTVLDVNDMPPLFTVDLVGGSSIDPLTELEYGSIVENLGLSASTANAGLDYRPTLVAHVTVTDPDTGRGGQLHCGINDTHNFHISEEHASPNSYLYRLSVRRAFDRELNASVTVNFTCSDYGLPPLESSRLIPFRYESGIVRLCLRVAVFSPQLFFTLRNLELYAFTNCATR